MGDHSTAWDGSCLFKGVMITKIFVILSKHVNIHDCTCVFKCLFNLI